MKPNLFHFCGNDVLSDISTLFDVYNIKYYVVVAGLLINRTELVKALNMFFDKINGMITN